MSRMLGKSAEQLAEIFFSKQGFILIKKNFFSRFGEIDLICKNQKLLLFIEVKSRTSSQFGHAFEMVSLSKQKKIRLTADLFLQTHPYYQFLIPRFDVLAFEEKNQDPIWIPNSF